MAKRTRKFGTLDVQASGSVRARYRGPDGNRYQKMHRSESSAMEWLERAEAAISCGLWTSPAEEARLKAEAERKKRVAATTVEKWAAQWLEMNEPGWAESTLRNYESRLRLHVIPTLGAMPVVEVTSADIGRWYRQLILRASEGARRPVYMTARAMFRSAVDEGLIESNPVTVKGADTHVPVRRVEEDGAGHVLSPGQVTALAEAVPDELRALVLIGAHCGLRLGELLGLRRYDVSLESQVIQVRRQAVVTKGGVKETQRLKTKTSRRGVPFPAFMVEMLELHMKEHARSGVKGLLFPREGGSGLQTHLHPNTVRKIVRAAAISEGLPMDTTPHDLRHTCMTALGQVGATLAEIMEMAGHRDVEVAMLYQHAQRNRLASLVAEVDQHKWVA
ncbi:tyrosine-type recombinase/integrase [Brevibacterium luteolum]|uniref:tyrosine-type recombinase/integrase n=1 Tax=Brevibacterium luteolum TaxID=199591 RepID=UPI0021B00002|nr:tyrosine-type recombinase/integrase [Brevibacterium luteolum]MCT1921514.1 tyrosine-type recombinase/integrase [Brevibacterium luteolum]